MDRYAILAPPTRCCGTELGDAVSELAELEFFGGIFNLVSGIELYVIAIQLEC